MSRRMRHDRGFRFAVLALTAVLSSAVFVVSPARAATTTVVSLTFDDGQSSQYSTLPMLSSRGMTGTYYINSAMVGSSGYYLTWPQIHDLGNAGNEIAGHTLHHTNLTTVGAAQARTEVCDDRTNLLNNGFSPVASFAYPEAESNLSARQTVRDCGYTSARAVGDVACNGCPNAETIPPADPYSLRTPDGVTTGTTLANLQSYVTKAENSGGGWVILTFHGICTNRCTGSNSMTPALFTAFLDWLAPRGANGTVVRTVGQVMGATPPGPDVTPPVTSIACNNAACATWYKSAVSVSLTSADTGGAGVARTAYTTDGTDPSSSGTTYTGPFTVSQTVTVRFSATDNAGNIEPVRAKLIQIDTTAPTTTLTAPANGSSVRRGALVTLTATAGDIGSGVARVAFAVDGTQVGTDSTAPYGFSWNTRRASIGQHTLTAVAYDLAGNTTTSPAAAITITR